MKFEHLLQVYWSKGFLIGGKIYSFKSSYNNFLYETPGISNKYLFNLIKRFELNLHKKNKNLNFFNLELNFRKQMNIYFSQHFNVNNSIFKNIESNLIRLYLIKHYKARRQALGKPSRGQRTWSNAWTPYLYNKLLRLFIIKNKKLKKKDFVKKIDYKKIKKKKLKIKRKTISKKKKTLK